MADILGNNTADQAQPVDAFTMVAQAQQTMSQVLAQLAAISLNNNNTATAGPKDGKPDTKSLPTFRGRIGVDNVDKFVDQMERAFHAFTIASNQRRVYYAVNQLRDTASNWWFAQRQTNGAVWEQTLTWPEFVQLLQQQFKPIDFNLLMRDKIDNLRQINSVDTYTNNFMDLISQLPEMAEDDRIHRYLHGLKAKTAAHVRSQQPATLQTAIDLASTFDHSYYRAGSQYSNSGYNRQDRIKRQDMMEVDHTQVGQQRSQQQRETRACFRCKKVGHIAANCWKSGSSPRTGSRAPAPRFQNKLGLGNQESQ